MKINISNDLSTSRTHIYFLFKDDDTKKIFNVDQLSENKFKEKIFKDPNRPFSFYFQEMGHNIFLGLPDKSKLSYQKLNDIIKNNLGKIKERTIMIHIVNLKFLDMILEILMRQNHQFDKYKSINEKSKMTKKNLSSKKFKQILSKRLKNKGKNNQNNNSDNNSNLVSNNKGSKLENIMIYLDKKRNTSKIRKIISNTEKITTQINFCNDLALEPANKLSPDKYIDVIKKQAKLHNYQVDIINQKKLKEMGMNLLLSVAKGSKYPAYFAVLKRLSKNKAAKNIVLLGKGVTFDTGGVTLKKGYKLSEMKNDMLGSSTVLAVINTISNLGVNSDYNIIGLLPIVENMIGTNATIPGDVVKSYSGKTVEIVDTDAEGRLILADSLSYAQKHFNNIEFMIDIATLSHTSISLGCGLFEVIMSNNKNLASKIVNLGNKVGERFVELPIYDKHVEDTQSSIADIKNLEFGNKCNLGNGIMGAAFLKNFVKDDIPWCHIDLGGLPNKLGSGIKTIVSLISSYKSKTKK